MPTGIAHSKMLKPPLLRKLDDASKSNPPKPDVATLLGRLDSGDNLVDIGIAHSWVRQGSFDEQHLRVDWLNETGQGWWGNTDKVLRAAFRRAANDFLDGHNGVNYSKTVDFYWAQSQQPSGRVYVTISHGAQITVTINTPPALQSIPLPADVDLDIVIVETDANGEAIISNPPLIPDMP